MWMEGSAITVTNIIYIYVIIMVICTICALFVTAVVELLFKRIVSANEINNF